MRAELKQDEDSKDRKAGGGNTRGDVNPESRRRSLGKRGRRRRRRKQLKKAVQRLSRVALWAVPASLIAAVIVVLVFPTALRSGRGGGFGNRAKAKGLSELSGEFPTTAAGWIQVLGSPEAGIREYRGAFDQDIEGGGALLEEVGNLDGLAATLLALGGTNQADVTRVFRAYGARYDSRRALGLAGALDVRSDPEASRWVAQALILSGDVLAFDQAWRSAPEAYATHAEMQPWRLAADALLRDEATSLRARTDLANMRTAAGASPSAWHALRLVAFLRGDVSGHHDLLVSHQTSGDQRLRHWMDQVELVLATEFDTEVDDILDGLLMDRTHPDEVIEAAKRLARLGHPSRAKRLIDRRLKLDGGAMKLAAMGAFCALAAEQWNECTRLAIALQMRTSGSGQLGALSNFLQGCAAAGSGSDGLAADAFDRMAFGSDPLAELQLAMLAEGVGLAADRLGKSSARQAWLVARELEGSLGLNASYWRIRSELAGYASQVPDMVLAARTALRLEPQSVASLSCLVRALLLVPDKRPEVLDLSAALTRESPVQAEWQILRALSFCHNNQSAAAQALLQPMRPSVIPPRLRGLMGVAWLDVHVASHDWDAARKTLDDIRSLRWEPLMQAKVDRIAARIPKP